MKKKQTLLCFFAIVTLIGTLILAPACSEENIITVNPSSEPLTREETRAMTEKAAEAFYADPALRDELESEITLKMEIVPAEGLPDDELAVYTLTHGERACASLWKRLESRMRTGAFRCISSSTAAEMRQLSLITMRGSLWPSTTGMLWKTAFLSLAAGSLTHGICTFRKIPTPCMTA